MKKIETPELAITDQIQIWVTFSRDVKSPENKKKETRQCTNLKSHSSGDVPHRPWRNVDSEKGQVHLGFASVYLPPSESTLQRSQW